jgi:Icc-related predicted phosphoesterase
MYHDVHNEGADILVIAGDVTNGNNRHIAKDFINEKCEEFEHVIMVPGNHEYYCREIREVDLYWKTNAHLAKNFVYLTRDYWIHPDAEYMFHGCTLWSDISNPIDRYCVANSLADFGTIAGMTPNVYQCLHQQDKMWLDDNLTMFKDDFKHVVITHHAPHWYSLHERFKYADNNAGFITDLDWMFVKHKIKLWMHGHVHNSFDYHVCGTRVVCNPAGYGYENREFKDAKILEI